MAYVEGHNRANGSEAKVEPPSNDEFDEMLANHSISNTVN